MSQNYFSLIAQIEWLTVNSIKLQSILLNCVISVKRENMFCRIKCDFNYVNWRSFVFLSILKTLISLKFPIKLIKTKKLLYQLSIKSLLNPSQQCSQIVIRLITYGTRIQLLDLNSRKNYNIGVHFISYRICYLSLNCDL